MNNIVNRAIEPAEAPSVILEKAKGVARIVLDRPANGNAIDLPLARELKQAMAACARDRAVRAVVITGRGRLFCSGGDLVAIHGEGALAPAYVKELLANLHDAVTLIASIDAPVIAAVNGTAAGAGLALAAACDLAVAIDSAKFVMAYTRVGLTPDGSSTWFLPRLVGLKRALELALLNRPLSAAEARDWGLVNEVVSDGAFEARIEALAASLAQGATHAFGEAKRLLRAAHMRTLDDQMAAESEAICTALEGEEARSGLAAFIAERQARDRNT